ncbi:unnamed protein product [Adineta steineri]|uniref:Uncharacterized protein n=1 Tax=Adineta steineri TaxID=433720 RepID=A0A819LWY8_9BILA|nr:unnamed protein product [Adineta steineri]CAF3968846.1 unnamed protein product [Adineta steineri]
MFFRQKCLTPEHHCDFAQLFDNLHTHSFYSHVLGTPELMLLEYDFHRKSGNDSWHTNTTFTERPAFSCVLYGHMSICTDIG